MYLSSQSLRKNERHRNIHHNLQEQTTTHVINTLRIAFSSTETPVYSHTLEDTIEYSSIQIQWMNGEYDFENGECNFEKILRIWKEIGFSRIGLV